ncbi:MAG: o-succinylbenzoate synthase [Reichenbachiella sp.]
MSLQLSYEKYTLDFKFDAGTSRGVLKTKDSWMLKLIDPANPTVSGFGEVSIIDRLSFDYSVDFELELDKLIDELAPYNMPDSEEKVYKLVSKLIRQERPAIRFGLETALLDLLNGGEFKIFDNDFFSGELEIPINGLIWMGEEDFMLEQIAQKLEQGYKCIKMKIGAIDFDNECKILKSIRKKHKADELTLRVDANGAFLTQDVLKKLDVLGQFDLHSIEQPVMPKQFHSMQLICKRSPVPIALDEELIGVFSPKEKRELLIGVNPAYIILKPSILGGFEATKEWIDLAEELGVGWWVTSALESNVGLNAICQFTAQYSNLSHQGLGTGQLYTNNFHSPLNIKGEEINYNQTMTWDLSSLKTLR